MRARATLHTRVLSDPRAHPACCVHPLARDGTLVVRGRRSAFSNVRRAQAGCQQRKRGMCNADGADEAAARYVAMRVRRGRAFEADFEPPTRRADTDATLVGPAL